MVYNIVSPSHKPPEALQKPAISLASPTAQMTRMDPKKHWISFNVRMQAKPLDVREPRLYHASKG
jgi:hypothetical protein